MGIKIIKNEKLWMETEAIQQLERIIAQKGVLEVVGLPDLHPGKTPVGATIKTYNCINSFLIGNDIGCGMSLYDTHLKIKRFNLDKALKQLEGTHIRGPYSIGGGNHFAELQTIDKIYHKEMANSLNLNPKNLLLLIHSGSRQLGEDIYRKYASPYLKKNTPEFDRYMVEHNKALLYAQKNRNGVADLFMDKLQMKYQNELIIECIHNYIECEGDNFYHHKGSISALQNEYAIIAGTRGSYSWIVKCIPQEELLYSVSHGSGRKWPRHLCQGKLLNKYKKNELKTTQMKNKVISSNQLLYEEAPEAYKNVNDVIDTLLEYNAIEIVARLKPMVTYKC